MTRRRGSERGVEACCLATTGGADGAGRPVSAGNRGKPRFDSAWGTGASPGRLFSLAGAPAETLFLLRSSSWRVT